MTITLYELAAKNPKLVFSPYCWRTRMSLLHKGLEFDAKPWFFADKSGTAETGYDRVPVINHDGKWVTDSLKITEYLDKEFPDRPLLISGEEGYASVQLVTSFCNTLFPALIPIAVFQVHQILDSESQTYFKESRESLFGKTLENINCDPETGKANLSQALSPFDSTLDSVRFFGGEQPSYADYVLFGMLKWVDVVSHYDPIDRASNVGEWFQRIDNLYDKHAANSPKVRD